MELIVTKNLTKTYQSGDHQLHALYQVDLEIKQGEFVALTGSSGAGKSTLMHLLGCLDTPTKGAYFLNGDNISSYNRKELAQTRNKYLGFVFQDFHLLNNLTAIENIMLPQIYGKVKEKVAKERAIELLYLVGLENRMEHYPLQLSGGQNQRIAVARALALEPKILLADEPTGNLDSENAQKIIDLFKEINRSKQTTIIIVTHEPSIAKQAQRCIVMKDGKISQDIRHVL